MSAITLPTITYKNQLKHINQNKIHLIHSPIDTNKFQPQSKSKLKEKYNYTNHKILFYYGGMWENKGINHLIKSLPRILQQIPNAKLLVAPRYKNIPQQQQLVQHLKLEQNVEFLFDNINIQDYVAMADCIALPYLNFIGTEGNPSCMLEAMACKTAVLTSNLPELKEIANNLVTFTPPNDIPSLAKNIIQTINHPNPKMLEQAYHKSQEFKIEIITDQFLEIYQS